MVEIGVTNKSYREDDRLVINMRNITSADKETAEPLEVDANLSGDSCDSQADTQYEKAKAKTRYPYRFLFVCFFKWK